MADAQQVMAKIAIEKERLRLFKQNQERTTKAQEAQQNYQEQPGAQQQQQPQQQEYAPPPQPDVKATEWAEREENSWFGQDRAMTATAFTIHQQLVQEEGFDPQSDEYYSEIDKRIRTEFPHKFEGKLPVLKQLLQYHKERLAKRVKKC